MKNIFRILMAAAVLLTASCAKEDISSTIGGGEVEVTFTANLAGLGTRAIADGNTVDCVYLAIFDANNDAYLQDLTKAEGYPVSNGLATIPVVLLKDKKYDLVFWAQKNGTGAYTLDLANRQVTANYDAAANNEARDAFFNISNDWTAGKDNTTFELRRPFAQINVGNSDADVKYAKQNGSVISQSAMTVTTKVYDTIELVNGSLTGTEVSAEFTLAAIPTETIQGTVDPTHDAALNASAEYNYLAMNYLLVKDRQLVDLVFNFTDGTTTFERKYYQVPVQRNYRTNILGQIISSPMDFTVEIKPGFDGDNNEMQVATAADFINAFANIKDGGTVTLQSNINFTEEDRMNSGGTWYEGVYYVGDKSFTIDLNGKTITNTDGAVNDYMMLFKNDGEKANTITFKNGTIDAGTAAYCALCTSTTSTQKITINLDNVNLIGNNSNGAVAKIRGGAELNVNAGTVITGKDSYVGIEAVGNNTVVNINEGAEIYQNGTSSYVGSIAGASFNATINVYGGEGVSAQGGFIAMTSGGTINISGGNWTANTNGAHANDNKSVLISQSANGAKCTVNVTGGTFKGGYNCYGNAVGDATINIYGGNFNADPATYVTAAGYAVVDNNDGTWSVYKQLTANDAASFAAAVAEGGQITLQNDITLDAPLAVEKNSIINLNGKTITTATSSAFEVKDGVKATITGNGTINAHEAVVRALGGEVIIENGTFTQTGTAASNPATYRYAVDCRNGGKITVNGGTFNSNNGAINVNADSEVVINGGNFNNTVNNAITRHLGYISGKLTINDGEFYSVANSAAGGCNLCIASSSTDIEINGGNFTALWSTGSKNQIIEAYASGGKAVVTGGIYNNAPAAKYIAVGYKALEVDGKYVVVPEQTNGVSMAPVTNKAGETYTGDAFASGNIDDALLFQNWMFYGDATIYVNRTYGAVILENVKGNINGDAIVVDNDNNSVMVLENVDLTLAEGKKLIKSVRNTIYQVFMANITINGVKQTQESIAQYLENVGWYQVVDEI